MVYNVLKQDFDPAVIKQFCLILDEMKIKYDEGDCFGSNMISVHTSRKKVERALRLAHCRDHGENGFMIRVRGVRERSVWIPALTANNLQDACKEALKRVKENPEAEAETSWEFNPAQKNSMDCTNGFMEEWQADYLSDEPVY